MFLFFFFDWTIKICLTNLSSLIEWGWNMQDWSVGSVHFFLLLLINSLFAVLWQIWPMPPTICIESIHVYILYSLRFGTKIVALYWKRDRECVYVCEKKITAENLRHLKGFNKLLKIFCSFYSFIVKNDNKKMCFFFFFSHNKAEGALRSIPQSLISFVK